MVLIRSITFFQTALTRLGLGSTIASNSLFLMTAEILSRVINLALIVALFRYLQPEGAGLMRFAMSYGVVLALLTEFGLTRAAVLQLTRGSTDELPVILGRVAALRTILVGVFLLVTALSLFTPLGQPLDGLTKLLIWIWSCSLAAQAFRRNADVVFQGVQKMLPAALLILFNRLLAVIGITLAVVFDWGIVAVFLAYFTADLLESITSALVVRRRFARPHYRISPRAVFALFVAGLPFGLHLVASQIYYYVDTLMLKYLFPADLSAVKREIGYYSNAYQIVLTLLFIPITLCNTMFAPLAGAWHRGDIARLRSLFNYSVLLLLWGGGPLALAFFLFRQEFIVTLFGIEYGPAVPMLAAVIWTLPLLFLGAPVSNFLAATGRQGLVTAAAFASAGFNIILNLYLIPSYGGLGTSISTTATEAFSLVLLIIIALSYQRAVFDFRRVGLALAAQVAAITALILFDRTAPGLPSRIMVYLMYAAGCAGAIAHVVRQRRLYSVTEPAPEQQLPTSAPGEEK